MEQQHLILAELSAPTRAKPIPHPCPSTRPPHRSFPYAGLAPSSICSPFFSSYGSSPTNSRSDFRGKFRPQPPPPRSSLRSSVAGSSECSGSPCSPGLYGSAGKGPEQGRTHPRHKESIQTRNLHALKAHALTNTGVPVRGKCGIWALAHWYPKSALDSQKLQVSNTIQTRMLGSLRYHGDRR